MFQQALTWAMTRFASGAPRSLFGCDAPQVAVWPRLAGDADLHPAVLAVDPGASDEGLGVVSRATGSSLTTTSRVQIGARVESGVNQRFKPAGLGGNLSVGLDTTVRRERSADHLLAEQIEPGADQGAEDPIA